MSDGGDDKVDDIAMNSAAAPSIAPLKSSLRKSSYDDVE